MDTKGIIEKDLFNPGRGSPRDGGVRAPKDTSAQLNHIVLLGTAILDNRRYAIFQLPSSLTRSGKAIGDPAKYLRLQLGDQIEGFTLSEIRETQAVFIRGSSKVEVLLDFSRKSMEGGEKRKLRSKSQHVESKKIPLSLNNEQVPGPPAPNFSEGGR